MAIKGHEEISFHPLIFEMAVRKPGLYVSSAGQYLMQI